MPPKPRRVALMLDLDWPYQRHLGIFAGTQKFADQHGWECTIDEFADHTLSRGKGQCPYDGVIARATSRLAGICRRRGIPLINVWANSPALQSVPSVLPDTEAVGRLAAEHLMARGLRNFAALMVSGSRASRNSCEAFARTVGESSFTCQTGRVPSLPTQTRAYWNKAERALVQWMDTWSLPIGVYIASDSPVRVVTQMCRRRNWRIPVDVAIIAGSDEPIICEHPPPSITSIKQGYDRIGYEAARLLDDWMTQGKKSPPREMSAGHKTMIRPQGLVMRQSTDFYAAEDPQVAAALRFIGDNCHKPIGVESVAQAVGISGRTLQKRFRKNLDRSIAAEIRRVRIERVKRELAENDRTLADIAEDVGLRNPQRLCNIFQREVGMSPGKYRKQWVDK